MHTKTNHGILLIFILFFLQACNQGAEKVKQEGATTVENIPVVQAPPDSLSLDPFYRKYLDASGIPVISSYRVPDSALVQAWRIVSFMMEGLPADVKGQMIGTGLRVGVMARYEGTTDIPEHKYLESDTSLNWDVRARGLGGDMNLPLTTCAEENLLCYQIDKYHAEDILVHEFAHSIHLVGIEPINPGFNDTLESLFAKVIDEGKYTNTYALTDIYEYWAEGVQNWFNVNAEVERPDGKHNQLNTRKELEQYDPRLYNLLSKYFLPVEESPSCHCMENQFSPPLH